MLTRERRCWTAWRLSNDVSMSATENGGQHEGASLQQPTETSSVLSQLPRTRPQRASARRVASREATASTNGRPGSSARKPAARTPAKAARKAPPRATPARKAPVAKAAAEPIERAPSQGFECEPERASRTVHPPGGAELVASAAEIVGELAKAGLSAGERVLKDVLSRLPLS